MSSAPTNVAEHLLVWSRNLLLKKLRPAEICDQKFEISKLEISQLILQYKKTVKLSVVTKKSREKPLAFFATYC